MTIYTCNDHMNAAICFTGNTCPLCEAMEYFETAEIKIKALENDVESLQDEVASLKEGE